MHHPVYPVLPQALEHTRVDEQRYFELYRESVEDNEGFWARIARRLDWSTPFSTVKDVSWDIRDLHIRWFEDGELNVCHNCIDRHLETRGEQTAIIWEGDDPARDARISYRELHQRVCRMANVIKSLGVGRGDRVTLYMPMIPEAAVAMLACARIGAVHSVVFGGFSPDALAGRIIDCGSKLVITADEGLRGGRKVALKDNVDAGRAKARRARHAAQRAGGAQHRCRGGLGRRLRPLAGRARGAGGRRLPLRADGRRRPACSSSTPPAPPASPRAFCTPPAATWCMRPGLMNWCSITRTARCSGAPPMSAGLPATPTPCMARWPMAASR